jgi:hypothetical protein
MKSIVIFALLAASMSSVLTQLVSEPYNPYNGSTSINVGPPAGPSGGKGKGKGKSGSQTYSVEPVMQVPDNFTVSEIVTDSDSVTSPIASDPLPGSYSIHIPPGYNRSMNNPSMENNRSTVAIRIHGNDRRHSVRN